jgi:hypothetical protein
VKRAPIRRGFAEPCVVCGGRRKAPKTPRLRRKAPKTRRHLAEAERDPFCSTDCAKKFYGSEWSTS